MRLLELLAGIVGSNLKGALARRWNLEHGVAHDILDDGAQTAGTEFELYCLIDDEVEGIIGERQFNLVHLEELLILADDGILRLNEDTAQSLTVEGPQIGEHRQTAYNLGDEPERLQVLRGNILHKVGLIDLRCVLDGVKAHHVGIQTLGNFLLNAVESSTADEEDIVGIDMDILLVGVLTAALRRNVNHRSLKEFQ